MQPNLYGGEVTKAYKRWLDDIPRVYAEKVLQEKPGDSLDVSNDPYALAIIKHYRSLMPMAQTARKPIFKLAAADGAIGAHWTAVQDVGREFRALAEAIDTRSSVDAAAQTPMIATPSSPGDVRQWPVPGEFVVVSDNDLHFHK